MISLILYWARWPLTGEVIFIILVGMPIYFYYKLKNHTIGLKQELKHGAWLPCYLGVIALLSYLGSSTFGGKGYFNTLTSTVLVGIVALCFYRLGLKSRLRNKTPQSTTEKVSNLNN